MMDTVNLLAQIAVLERRLENAVEVVRCKECKRANYEPSGIRCGLSDVLMGEDGFCSIGEREGE